MPAQILIVDDYSFPSVEKYYVWFTRHVVLEAIFKEKKKFKNLSRVKVNKFKKYEFIFASTSQDALKIIESGRHIDLVLTEFSPPHIDAIKLLKEIKNQNLNVRVVVRSQFGYLYPIQKAVMEEGAFNCVSKETFDELYTMIEQSLAKSTVTDSNPSCPNNYKEISRPAKILVVDYEPLMGNLFNSCFKEERVANKYQFIFVCNIEDALEVINSNPDIELILTDIRPPHLDGMELLKEVKNRNLNIKIAVFSAVIQKEKLMKEGAFNCLKKPFETEELKQLIGQGLALKV